VRVPWENKVRKPGRKRKRRAAEGTKRVPRGWGACKDGASHDVDHYGVFDEQKTRAVASLKTRMRVVASIEAFNSWESMGLYVLAALRSVRRGL